MADTLAFLQQSNAASEVMRHKGLKMVERDFVPQAKLSQHLKDVRLMLDQASATGTKLHLTPLHARLLRELEESGHGELDNSAILLAFLPDGKHANCSSD
jgi:3-hydroxyisobutyrate dehydrogenase-like beta-hydroxyacid dehydrogenase